jgi:putative addiction module component (TIGR02574 family)
MARTLSEIEKEALQLPPRDRAELAAQLITSLEPEEEADTEVQWLEEAERRYQAYRGGKLKSKPAQQVFQDAISKLR